MSNNIASIDNANYNKSSQLKGSSFPSTVKLNHFGRCLVATKSLEKGTIVEQFKYILTENAYKGHHDASLEYKHVILVKLSPKNYAWGRVTSDAAYINHSCNPNCRRNSDLEVVTIRAVDNGEELTIPYDEGSEEDYPWDPEWNFKCLCGAVNCRKEISSYKESPNSTPIAQKSHPPDQS